MRVSVCTVTKAPFFGINPTESSRIVYFYINAES